MPFARRGRKRHRGEGSGLGKGGGIDAPMATKRFAMRLKRLRAERQISQADLARASGVSREYIARLELGQQDPTLGTMQKLAKALKVKAGELLE